MNPTDLLNAFKQQGCFPHQAEFAAAFFAPDSARKHLLVSAPGFGKGFAAGAIINHALSSSQAWHILVLSPSALLAQWRDVIQRGDPKVPILIVDRRRLRELEASQPVGEDFWPAIAVVVMSIEFAKQSDVADSLNRTSWDVLVVDEVHRITPQTQRIKMLADLFVRSPKMRALFLRVGGPGVSSEIDTSSDLLRDTAITVWSRESVRDNEGKPLLPEVHIEWITHHRQADEAALLARLQDSLRSVSDTHAQTRLISVGLLQAASSSLFALEQSLRRILRRRNELVHWRNELVQGIAEGKEGEQDAERLGTDELFAIAEGDQIASRLEFAEIASSLLGMLEKVTTDSKYDTLLQLLTSLGIRDGNELRVCVFTKFVDTATYLESSLRDRYSQVRVLTGSLEFGEREQIVADFARNGGVLIATESMATTIPEVAAVVFYDLPLNPGVLEARIGQFVRVGLHGPIRIFAFTDKSDALVIERLQKKIAEIKEVLGEQEIDSVLFSKK